MMHSNNKNITILYRTHIYGSQVNHNFKFFTQYWSIGVTVNANVVYKTSRKKTRERLKWSQWNKTKKGIVILEKLMVQGFES